MASHVWLATQAPETQLWVCAQAEQLMPPRPHADSDPPDTHWPWSQHPAQFDSLQAVSTHLPLLHVWSAEQAVQDAPFAPQADAVGDWMHLPVPSQQPLQLAGPHVVGTPGEPVESSSDAQPAAIKPSPAANTKA